MHSENTCNVGPLIRRSTWGHQGEGESDDRHGDDASNDTCMLMMTDVNVIHASIRCDDPSYEIGNSRTGHLGKGERCCWCTSKTLLR